jgi:hypothetical protein
MIPAAMIERMVVSRTFTPDLPGGFAGGAANIITRAFPDKFKLSVSLGMEYNTQATGNEDFLNYRGGGTDWAAFDDGTRELPVAAVGERRELDAAPGHARDAPPGLGPPGAGRPGAGLPELVQVILSSRDDGGPAPNTGGALSVATPGGR